MSQPQQPRLARWLVVVAALAIALNVGAWLLRPSSEPRGADSPPRPPPLRAPALVPAPPAPEISASAEAPADPPQPSLDGRIISALAQGDAAQRARSVEAALRAWAAADFAAASAWALSQTVLERTIAIAAVVQGGVRNHADAATRFVEQLNQDDPVYAMSHGGSLIFALSQIGEHERAASFAAAGAPEFRDAWIAAAFRAWGEHEPEVALDAALMFDDDPPRQQAAFRAAMSGWAAKQPARAVACALEFPEGPEKRYALLTALRAWRANDRIASATWIEQNRTALAAATDLERVFED